MHGTEFHRPIPRYGRDETKHGRRFPFPWLRPPDRTPARTLYPNSYNFIHPFGLLVSHLDALVLIAQTELTNILCQSTRPSVRMSARIVSFRKVRHGLPWPRFENEIELTFPSC